MILDKINKPKDLNKLNMSELNSLADEMRELIIKKVNNIVDLLHMKQYFNLY